MQGAKLPAAWLKRLPPLSDKTKDPLVRAKIIVGKCWAWYVVAGERAPTGDWHLYGLIRGHELRMGYFTLREVMAVKGPLGERARMAPNWRSEFLSSAVNRERRMIDDASD